jgi:hypothetical protein
MTLFCGNSDNRAREHKSRNAGDERKSSDHRRSSSDLATPTPFIFQCTEIGNEIGDLLGETEFSVGVTAWVESLQRSFENLEQRWFQFEFKSTGFDDWKNSI